MARIEAATCAFVEPYAVVFLHKNNSLPHLLLFFKFAIPSQTGFCFSLCLHGCHTSFIKEDQNKGCKKGRTHLGMVLG